MVVPKWSEVVTLTNILPVVIRVFQGDGSNKLESRSKKKGIRR